MKNITKRFIEIYRLDMEGRRGWWEGTDKTYDEAVAAMDGWNDAVREVEKTFHPDTFEITERTIRKTEKDYEGRWTWDGKTKTTIY